MTKRKVRAWMLPQRSLLRMSSRTCERRTAPDAPKRISYAVTYTPTSLRKVSSLASGTHNHITDFGAKKGFGVLVQGQECMPETL